jgi:hypothetical protein
MRFVDVRVSILLLVSLVGTAPGKAQTTMSDPVFGMSYDARYVRFEEVPKRFADVCPRLREERYWLYAYFEEANTEYLVVSSRGARVSGGGVVIRGRACEPTLPDVLLYGIADADDKDIAITPTIKHGLAADLFRRYGEAFGGKKNFLARQKKSWVDCGSGSLPSE